jgi:deoxyribonuclease-1
MRTSLPSPGIHSRFWPRGGRGALTATLIAWSLLGCAPDGTVPGPEASTAETSADAWLDGSDALDAPLDAPQDLVDASDLPDMPDSDLALPDGATADVMPVDVTADTAVDTTWPDDVALTGAYADLEGLQGPALSHALCEMVRVGYKSLSYDQARIELFQVVEAYDGDVHEIYTGAWLPQNLSQLNTEHTWPQSLGATGAAKSDLHHLMPALADFNSARGNLPYGKVKYVNWPNSPMGNASCTDHWPGNPGGCFSFRGKDASGVQLFEPRDAHKGNAARALFYFAVRWGSTDCKPRPFSDLDPAHPAVTVATLKVWNFLDPPDDAERDRNDRIEKLQKTRNPFIDHPELVDHVGF